MEYTANIKKKEWEESEYTDLEEYMLYIVNQ